VSERSNYRKKATRDSWKAKALPQSVTTIQFTRIFSAKEYEQLSYGRMPVEMEDKWFIYLEQDHLYFHRSWTGYCIFRLRFERDGHFYSVVEAMVNRDPDEYGSANDAYDAAILSSLIDNLLLNDELS